MEMNAKLQFVLIIIGLFYSCARDADEKMIPVRIVTDIDIGETQQLKLTNGTTAEVTLVAIKDSVDRLNSAVRAAKVEIDVNGQTAMLYTGNYNLPVTVGYVQIDCPVTRSYMRNSRHRRWALEKDARLRLWPSGSPLLHPGTFVYPLQQRFLANDTQMDDDPVYVNGGERPGQEEIYYHSGLDFGGSEGRDVVLSAVDGLVISAGGDSLAGYHDKPEGPARDGIHIIDSRGWCHGYFHLFSIDPAIHPGIRVKKGQKIGLIGKEGAAGGWAHLHYAIKCKQPSGGWGDINAYPFIWEAYVNQVQPAVIAVARPHIFAPANTQVHLDGSKSRSFTGDIMAYDWIFSDGSTAKGARQERRYASAGTYSEVLKVTNENGDIDYDYTVVQVVDMEEPEKLPPTIHAVYYPSTGIKARSPVIFGVRTFRTTSGHEEWDFGDGSAKVMTESQVPDNRRNGKYAEVLHRFNRPGDYLVRVERTDENGSKAVAHLHVHVE